MLWIAAIGKIVSLTKGGLVFERYDPIFHIKYRFLFGFVSVLEIIVALICFFGRRIALQAGALVLLASDILLYRLGLVVVNYHRPCSCLGSFTDALHISPGTADNLMKAVLVYLIAGGYGALIWLQWQSRQAMSNPI